MVTSVKKFRQLVRAIIRESIQIIAEDDTAQTVPAAASKSEQEFEKDMNGQKWGKQQDLRDDQTKKKLQRVKSALQASGQFSKIPPEKREEAMQRLEAFVSKMDPSDRLVKTADEIADEFVKTPN